jgi:glutaredoxin
MIMVTIFSRTGCHLCEVALSEIEKFKGEFDFEIEEIFINGDLDLEKKYSEEVPVILINGKQHDFFKVDPERFRSAMQRESHLHQ